MTLQTQNLQNRLNTPAQSAGQTQTLAVLLQRDDIKKRFADVLGTKAEGFMTSILSTTNNNANLRQCDPNSIIGSAMIAAALDLPVDPNLGFAYIVPYGRQAQLQIGWKGFVQLAMRSGAYKTINVCEVYEGEIAEYNRFTGNFSFGEKTSDKVIGYVAYFKLLNGYEKYLYMTVAQIHAHAKQYSKTYSFKGGVWQTNFHAMAMKTVLKRLLSKFGILSIEMQLSLKADQAAVRDVTPDNIQEADFEYVDGGRDEGDVIDVWAEAEQRVKEQEASK